MICENIKLGGYLVKWALKKKDGRYYERDCKKHNTITKSCLNNLLEFNGPGTSVSTNSNDYRAANLWVTGSGSNGRNGVLNSCALGNGTGETSVNDTELKHKVGSYTTTKKTGSEWCGSSFDNNNRIARIRISHVHTISESFTIKEIGWFNRIYPDGIYSLSARVQLEDFVDVESGDTFYTTYEIVIQLPGNKTIDLPIIGKCVSNTKLVCQNPSFGYAIPSINQNGQGFNYSTYGSPDAPIVPIYVTTNSNVISGSNGNAICNKITTNTNNTTSATSAYSSISGAGPFNVSLHPYVIDSFYRDVEFSIPAANVNIYGFVCLGTAYRLGEYDENNNFVPNPYYMDKALKFTLRQRWSTDLITPAA